MRALSQSNIYLETLAHLRRLKDSATQVEARVEFTLRHKTRLAPLSEAQVGRFHRDGFLLVSGLIPDTVAREAAAALWRFLGTSPDDPGSWQRLGPQPYILQEPAVSSAYTDEFLAAAAQLSGEDVSTFRRPRTTCAFIRPVECERRTHPPHIDRMIPGMRYRTSPRSYRVGALTYLTDVKPRGGGTVVWPGSHLKLEALAREDPARFKYLWQFGPVLERIDFGPSIELAPSRGDVLFHHHLFVHAISDNVTGPPRLALNQKW
jgi:hypothetical protein